MQAKIKQPQFEVIGARLHIRWNEHFVEASEDQDEYYSYDEVILRKNASRSEIIEAIIAYHYPTAGAEFAAINNGGVEYDLYQSHRALAKNLTQQYFSKA
jgi:hypothetical protein